MSAKTIHCVQLSRELFSVIFLVRLSCGQACALLAGAIVEDVTGRRASQLLELSNGWRSRLELFAVSATVSESGGLATRRETAA